MILETLTLPLMWLLNGLLAVLYLSAENALVLVLFPGLAGLWQFIPAAQRNWMWAVMGLASLAALLAPPVVGIWLILMAYGAILGIKLEKFNAESLSWRVLSGLAAYALIGVGYSLYQALAPSLLDPYGTFAQAKGYLDILIGLAVFLGPLGYLGLLVQSLLAHPPLEGQPEEIVYQVRTRGTGH